MVVEQLKAWCLSNGELNHSVVADYASHCQLAVPDLFVWRVWSDFSSVAE